MNSIDMAGRGRRVEACRDAAGPGETWLGLAGVA
jgi:hypothetical protein